MIVDRGFVRLNLAARTDCSEHVLLVFPQRCGLRREEKKVEKAIREAAKRNDMASAKVR